MDKTLTPLQEAELEALLLDRQAPSNACFI